MCARGVDWGWVGSGSSEMNNRSEISVIKTQASCPLRLIHERTLTRLACVAAVRTRSRVRAGGAHALLCIFICCLSILHETRIRSFFICFHLLLAMR